MGSAVAYFLSEHESFDGDILVVEADPTYERASTPLSGGSFRQQFSNELNIKASQFALDFIDDWHDRTHVEGHAPDLGFVDTGYLFLIDEPRLGDFEASHHVQRDCGAPVRLLSPSDLGVEFPHINSAGLVAASLGQREGTLDPWAFMRGFSLRARSHGVEYVHDQVIGIDVADHTVRSVRLACGATINCSRVVNCAGVRANELADMVGLGVPIEARSRTSFVFDCREPIEGQFPLTIDTSGVHVRREGHQYLSGAVPTDDRAVDPNNTKARVGEFEELIWPALSARIPQFDQISLRASWGGHYAYNTLDHNMIVGVSPIGGFYFCNGFSGHGLQQAPAVGRAIAEMIVHGSYQTLDFGPLGFDRILANKPVVESNII